MKRRWRNIAAIIPTLAVKVRVGVAETDGKKSMIEAAEACDLYVYVNEVSRGKIG